MTVTFITGNVSKAEQLERYLEYPVKHKNIDLPEIQSLDIQEIVARKAKEAYGHIRTPVLVEDTSLVFHALGNLPGPLIKWFLVELGNEGLCELLDGYKDRFAKARVCFGFYDGKELKLFEAEVNGTIANSPKGERGFGWDPIFIPEGNAQTWGEMDIEKQKETSMRKIALKKLGDYLKSHKNKNKQ